MRYAQINSRYYCGIDLHSRTMYVCVMDPSGQILFHRNMKNDFAIFKKHVKSFLPDLAVGVESSGYYYWLADACREAGIDFHLGHALYMKAIHGSKTKNDRIDSRKITHLMRTHLFPMAYPYPKEMRATRDLLRRRHHYVWQRAAAYSHIQTIFVQHGLLDINGKQVKDSRSRRSLVKQLDHPDLQLIVSADLDLIEALDEIIAALETQIRRQARHHDRSAYELLLTIPGVGDILALIILYETHDIGRFEKVQRYSSYCGVVKCEWSSAGKSYNPKNQKIRNPYLKWAYGDIIMSAQRCSPPIAKLYERLKSKYGTGRAKSIIAHRFAVAGYFMLKNKQGFDVERFVRSTKYQ